MPNIKSQAGNNKDTAKIKENAKVKAPAKKASAKAAPSTEDKTIKAENQAAAAESPAKVPAPPAGFSQEEKAHRRAHLRPGYRHPQCHRRGG